MRVLDKPLGDLQKGGVKAPLCHHGAEKSTLSKTTVAQMRQQRRQLEVMQKVNHPPEQHKWSKEDEASLTQTKSEVIDLTNASTKLGAERQIVWQEHKRTVENCCKLHDNKAKLELIKMLLKSMGRKASLESMERKASKASSDSDDETIIPDNTQAQILLQRSTRTQKDAPLEA